MHQKRLGHKYSSDLQRKLVLLVENKDENNIEQ